MSALFNQTNLNPNSFFWTQGSGTSNYNSLEIQTGGSSGKAVVLSTDPNTWVWGPGSASLTLTNGASNYDGITASYFLATSSIVGVPQNKKTGQYLPDGILYQGKAGSGAGSYVINVNDPNLGGPAPAFALNAISSINGRPMATPIYTSSLTLSDSPTIASGAEAGISTLLTGMPTGSNVFTQAAVSVATPTGSNIEGILWMGMGTTTGGTQNFLPVYFNTQSSQSNASVNLTGLISIPSASDNFVITASNSAGNVVIAPIGCSQVKFVNM